MSKKNYLTLLFAFFFLVALHYSTSVYYPVPYVAPDEISYLAQASYFAGNTETPDVAVFFSRKWFK
jgi:hypothetical protein